MKTAPINKKVRELITMVNEGKLLPRPEFQRRLIWTRDDKNKFLDSVLRGYPFPEIYFADGDVDLETGQGTQLLVDGQQRVTTLIQYFSNDPDLRLTTVPSYRELSEEEKKAFLQYDVAVRDLGGIGKEEIVEVFKRINATKYSLLDIEINNAVYAGALKSYAESLADNDLFKSHSVFNSLDYKRMGDLRYALSIIITLIQGYFNRDDAFEDCLARYNDDFPLRDELDKRIRNVILFIEECGFAEKSRVWRKADLFTFFVELDQQLNILNNPVQPIAVLENLETLYGAINAGQIESQSVEGIYYKAALQASNDKLNRVRRGLIVSSVIEGKRNQEIIALLSEQDLI
jgi:hypothetical protein